MKRNKCSQKRHLNSRGAAALLLALAALSAFATLAAGALGGVLDSLDDLDEDLGDVDVLLGGRLDEVAAEGRGEVLALFRRDVALLHVALVADEDHRDVLLLLDAEDLRAEFVAVVERGRRVDGVDEDEAVSGAHVGVSQRRELFLSGGIQDVEHDGLAVDVDLLSVEVFDGGVVLFDELALDEADGDARLAHAARAHNYDLVSAFGHEKEF